MGSCSIACYLATGCVFFLFFFYAPVSDFARKLVCPAFTVQNSADAPDDWFMFLGMLCGKNNTVVVFCEGFVRTFQLNCQSIHEDLTGSGDNNGLTNIFEIYLIPTFCMLHTSFAPFRVGSALRSTQELARLGLDWCCTVASQPIQSFFFFFWREKDYYALFVETGLCQPALLGHKRLTAAAVAISTRTHMIGCTKMMQKTYKER